MQYVGKIDKSIFKEEFGELLTDEVILTEERMRHIKGGHAEDVDLFKKYTGEILKNPDLVLKDSKNANTVFMIKHIGDTNMNIILKLAIYADEKHPKNSIMTAYRIRDKNVKKLKNKHKTLYKNE